MKASRNLGDRYEKETTSRTFSGEGLQQSNLQYQQPTLQQQPTYQQQSMQNLPSNQQFQQKQFLSSQRQSIVEPVVVQEKPVVIHERIRKEEVEEIQPIIHREHEQLEVHQILQPMVEQIVQPTVIQERILVAETRPLVHRGGYMGSVAPVATSDVQSFRKVVEKPAIIVDVERRKVLEEIQPVVYKEILQPTIIRETRDIYEKIIEAPTIICSTLPQQFVGKAQPQFEPTLRSSSLQGQNLQGQTFQGQTFQSSNLQNQNLQGQNLQGQTLQGQTSFQNPNLQYRMNQPSAVSQRETVDRWVSPAPMSSTRV